jgi:hypothetical protein
MPNDKVKRLRTRVRRFVPGAFVFGKGLGLLYSKRSFLRNAGYVLSVRLKRPVRADGSPLPWMTYSAIAIFEKRLAPDATVFEFGSGNSTLFFARLVGKVVSVECDKEWYETLSRDLPPNAELILCHPYEREAYLACLTRQQQDFDVIVVDAEDREGCLHLASTRLSARGVIVLDDADRPPYQAEANRLITLGFKRLDFEGLKPGGIRSYATAVFYRPGNVLGI